MYQEKTAAFICYTEDGSSKVVWNVSYLKSTQRNIPEDRHIKIPRR
jgi:hypothetical protein